MLRTLRTNLQTLGWWNGMLYLLGTALSRLSADRLRLVKYDLVSQPITTAPLLPEHRGKKIQVREAISGDPLLQGVPDRREGVFAERFARGARCLVAELNGELAGFLWFVQGDYPEDEVRCLFRPLPEGQSVWDYDVYVAKKHRLSPVFLKLWQAANERLYAEGIHHSASRISAFNPASRGSHQRLGAHKTGWALFVCAGPWQGMLASCRPFVHLSLSPGSQPTLKVRPPATAQRGDQM
ncbi:GNAT family N-acetyltransferase [Thiohalophilus sp.]|uniref:GNAT family N-acetyltransferase n=1 Tax=Thiohalophilus sp. TaxID=3028392 RepID=UPI002ACE806F|nr:GNAT family N-acetyltransferase [Thiohalophilus sp.]MDZ7803494.1 hypothetical protein [Thiohalophilus sp.]